MTPPGDFREIAFWLDSAMLSLTSFHSAALDGDEASIRARFRTLVSVSCEYEPQWNDYLAADTFAQIDALLRNQCPNPDALRRAYRTSPNSPLWASGDYTRLSQPTEQP